MNAPPAFPQRSSMLSMTDEDREAIEWALRVTSMEELRYRPIDELSGGQRQRAWIGLVLAQGTDLILLDEPTTFLDIAYQLDVLELLRELNQKEQKTIVMVLHDINMAAEYAHSLLALRAGEIVAAGSPKEILSTTLIRDVFGIESRVIEHPVTGQPMCLPIPGADRTLPPTALVAPSPA